MVLESNEKDFNKFLLSFINNEEKDHVSSTNSSNEKKTSSKKITIEVDEDDPCLQDKRKTQKKKFYSTPGLDPRFQQQNQTLRCYVMYTDFYRCEHILGEGHDACTWFKQVFRSICPNDWIRNWDELRINGKLPWHKYYSQGEFPGDKYGV
ncbi:PREDICTED: cytochrome c oxidase subunit 6b-1-like [Polistes dominula]|uniref:Cytochrome c oxidase subunit 6b-1-like n=1 Tax=Polistes dominula TaxID=743375 RepID=A0ABM1IDL9_POLDO|nr:PREDICTED: cytochrome c oxidase subunit 6b-1-like [Polistes dominula]